ncbi:GNAT family N-acetyltransferase [Arthrobacter sp. RIT-PI-e]|uniref:GNAT family N-acetyltransferase n=1 Tax=Arthrobacter sp. RIT-PI-e TaxID=1681197 RepID=UPI0009E3A6E9|nr:GNAT family N-acetyltransferase [Arthrobacter sp. RIT-PI-e]
MLIRQAMPDDVDGVGDISRASGRDVWDLDTLRTTSERLVVVADLEGQLVGAAKTHFHAHPDNDAPSGHYLGGVMVLPSCRRQGIASALTRARLEWIWSRTDRAYYFANEHNTPSMRLHEAFGFRVFGTFSTIHGVTADGGQSNLILFAAAR